MILQEGNNILSSQNFIFPCQNWPDLKTTWGPILWDTLYAKTVILKGYEERRYPSVNQACTVEKYKMPKQEEVVEDIDEEEGSFKKVSEWTESAIKNMYNCTENEADMKKLYHDIQMRKKLSKYFSGVNKKGQEMERTWDIVTMKRKKVGYIY